MLNRTTRHSCHHKSSATRRRSRALNCAILETLESRTLLSGLDFSGGFANTAGLTLDGPAAISGTQLQLPGNNASAWSTLPRDVTQFTTSFSFRSVGPSPGSFAFVLQANSNATVAGGLDHTVSLVFNPPSSSQFVPPGATGLFANGISANYGSLVNNSFSGMNFDNGDIYNVTLNYPVDSGGTQTILQTVIDTNTGATFSFDHEAIDIPALVGGGGAYVGFTGISGAYDILSWTYSSPAVGSTPFSPSFLHYAPYTDPYRVDLSWTDNSTNEDGFVVERSVEGGPWSDLATLPANAASYSDSAISFLTHYRYAVRAVNGAGSSVESNVVEARPSGQRPAAPSAATATPVSPNEVDLTWQDNNFHSGHSFRVYRRIGGAGDYTLLAQLPTDNQHTIVSFADTQAPSGTLLEYHIVCSDLVSDYTHDAESDPVYVSATTPQTDVDHFGPTIALNGSAHMVGSALQLTDNQPVAEAGSALTTLRHAVDQFTTQFSFQFANSDVGGFTFAMVGASSFLGSPRGLGYGEGPNTGDISLAIDFTVGSPYTTGGGGTGILFNTIPRLGDSVDVTSSGIDFHSGHTFNATLSMDGRIGVSGNALDETIVDTTTGATFRHTYWIQSMANVLDFVGFTAGKPASSQQSVNILSWSYSTNNQANPTTTFLAGNAAPILSGTNNFPTISEDNLGGSDLAVDTLITNHVTDSDGPAKGIAITALNSGNGIWQYTTNGGATWLPIGAVSETSALLLDDPHHIRFVPDGKNGTTATVTFRAWDESNGANLEYTYADVSTNGGSTPYSAASATATVTVTDVNDRPFFIGPSPNPSSLSGLNFIALDVVPPGAPPTIGNVPWVANFPQITEDDLSNSGVTVSELIAGRFLDVDQNALPMGIAAVGQANTDLTNYAGIWQYSLDNAVSWLNFGPLTAARATILGPDARVRLKPNGKFGTNTVRPLDYLMIQPWDHSDGSVSGQTGVNANHNDPTGAYGPEGAATQFVQDINDAPVLTGTLDFPIITEDDGVYGGLGQVSMFAQDLVGNFYSDPDSINNSHNVQGLALIGQNPNSGTWLYLDNNSQWQPIGPVSQTSALLLPSYSRISFIPDGKNGTTASLTFRAWDVTNGLDLAFSKVDTSVNGGTSPYSAQTATTHITATDVNDSPLLDGTNDFPAITEDDLNNNGQTVAALIAGHVSDVDHDAQSAGIAVAGQTSSTGGTWQYSLDNGGSWRSFGTISPTSATVLATDARVRLRPTGLWGTNASGGDSLSFTAWDRTDGIASGTTGVNIILPNSPYGFHISPYGGGATANIFVADVNDAPVLNGVEDFPTIRADDVANNGIFPNGLSTFILGHESDVDLEAPYTGNAHNTRAVAIVGQDAGNGTWQYHNGLAWTNIGAVSNTSALLITSQPVRFVPNGHDGTTASLTLRAWDGYNNVELTGTYVDVSLNGGTSPYSAQTAITHITVTPTIVTSSLTVSAPNSTYNAHPYTGTTASVTPAADTGPVTFIFYTAADTLRTNPIPVPTNAGTYQVVAHVAAIPGYTAADSAPVTFTIAKAALSGIATTQDALNIAKQGAVTIDINSIVGLQGSDTVVSIFSSALFSLTIGVNTYLFAPTVTIDSVTQTIHVAYSLKAGTASADTLRADLLALDAADGTLSTSAAKTPYSIMWITADSLNYTLTDDFLSRLFSSK